MKSSKGFTLIEVLMAIVISAILLPVASLVFYQLMISPPNTSLHLSLGNELGTLSSVLYRDGYMAENFSKGTFPCFGNFSWTDYTSDTHYNISYLFHYDADRAESRVIRRSDVTHDYSKGQSKWNVVTSSVSLTSLIAGNSTSCNNFSLDKVLNYVVANMTAGNNDSVGKYVQKQLTLYIGLRPSSFVKSLPQTYCSGWGIDKWAWGRTWSNQEWVWCKRPLSVSDFLKPGVSGACVGEIASGYSLVPGNASIYSWICTPNDGLWWLMADYKSNPTPHEDSQLYKIKVNQDRTSVSNISVTYIGRGPDPTTGQIYTLTVSLWNYKTGKWTRFVYADSTTTPHSYTMTQYFFSVPPGPDAKDYIGKDTGSDKDPGNVSILVAADFNPSYMGTGVNPLEGLYTDFIELTVQ